MAFNFSPKVVTDGLVLALDAANPRSYTSGSLVWNDLTSNGNSGTLINGPTFSSANGGSIVFDGINDYVNCGNNSTLNVGNNITLICWFYVNSVSGYQPIAAKHNSNSSAGWELANSSGFFRSTLRPFGTEVIAGTLAIGNWYMGTVTFDNTTLKLYLNKGQTGSTVSGGTVVLDTTRPLQIGTREILGISYYNGNISQFLMYNRALSPTEIIQNYNALKGRFNLT